MHAIISEAIGTAVSGLSILTTFLVGVALKSGRPDRAPIARVN